MSLHDVPVLKSALVQPGYSLAELVPKRAVRIALVGPDGVGKSTAIGLLKQWFQEELPQVTFVARRWRPALLPDLGVFIGKPSQPVTKTVPRRQPGRFHFVRLLYYFLDFLIGSWWKDRIRTPAAALIIYDRCALDMYVDPVRFALRSRFGTRLLWKLTPRPDLIVLLHDNPERIWQRKRELQRHEMAEQMATWFELLESGHVDAAIRVDAGAGEIGARLRNLVLDKLYRPSACASEGCLTPTAQAEGLCRHAVLPSARRPRLLIPLASRRIAARSLDIYNAQSLTARVAKGFLAAGLRAGIAQPFLRDKCSLDALLQEHLRQVLGCSGLTCAVSTGTPNRSQKPVLQLMDEGGHILGYAKIGWNERTIGLVRNEASVLDSLRNRAFTTTVVPRILHAGTWRQLYILVQSAPGGRVRRAPSRLDYRHIRFLCELQRTCAPVLPPPSLSGQLDALAQMGFHYYVHLLESGLRAASRELAGEVLPAGFGHGDFAPWNIRLEDDRLLVLDWEYGGPGRPLLWDLFHFVIQSAMELHGSPASQIFGQLLTLKCYCRTLEVADHLVQPLLIAYVCDALSGNLLLHGTGPDRKDQLARATLGSLLTILCRPGGHRV